MQDTPSHAPVEKLGRIQSFKPGRDDRTNICIGDRRTSTHVEVTVNHIVLKIRKDTTFHDEKKFKR